MTTSIPRPEHPKPQFFRESWINLNGTWTFQYGSKVDDIATLSSSSGFSENILIPFCPEDAAFGSPRPTMDLVETEQGHKALSNLTGEDFSDPIIQYATAFFDRHKELDLFIGKDRSPSCGVCSARLYDKEKNLLSAEEAGLMAKEAKKRNINCIDAEDFRGLK